jgi:putative SOS response-associated peptidase YedK
MCGRVRLSSDYSEIEIALQFDLAAPAPNFEADWNKPPTAPMLVAIRSEDGKRIPKMMRWGLLPHWAKDEKLSYSTFNARSRISPQSPRFATLGCEASAVSLLPMASMSGTLLYAFEYAKCFQASELSRSSRAPTM